MTELDPQAELTVNATCPVCRCEFSALFDTAAFFFRELSGRTRHLYREIHLLASFYHWSERDILEMTPRKRSRYLELVDETLSGGTA